MWFGDRSPGTGTFGRGEFGARHCNQWGLYGERVRQCHDAALFPDYFEQTCCKSDTSGRLSFVLYVLVFAIANPSVVCNVRAPYSGG